MFYVFAIYVSSDKLCRNIFRTKTQQHGKEECWQQKFLSCLHSLCGFLLFFMHFSTSIVPKNLWLCRRVFAYHAKSTFCKILMLLKSLGCFLLMCLTMKNFFVMKYVELDTSSYNCFTMPKVAF